MMILHFYYNGFAFAVCCLFFSCVALCFLFSGFPSLCCISKGFLYTYSCQKEAFVWYLPWKPARAPASKSHHITEATQRVGLPGVFNSSESPALTLCMAFLHTYCFLLWFPPADLCSYKPINQVTSIRLSVSTSRGSGLPCVLSLLTDLRRVVDFSVCSFLLVRMSDDFQIPCETRKTVF